MFYILSTILFITILDWNHYILKAFYLIILNIFLLIYSGVGIFVTYYKWLNVLPMTCHTTCILDMRYGLIHLCRSYIVKPSIPSKPRLHVRFGLTMINWAFTLPPPKAEVSGKSIHRQTTINIDRSTKYDILVEPWE